MVESLFYEIIIFSYGFIQRFLGRTSTSLTKKNVYIYILIVENCKWREKTEKANNSELSFLQNDFV